MEASFPLNDKKEHLTIIVFQLDWKIKQAVQRTTNSSLEWEGDGREVVPFGRPQGGWGWTR